MKRFFNSREFYVPQGWNKVADKQSDAIAYIHTCEQGRFYARIFFGNQAKPVSAYYYRTAALRDKAVTSAFESRRARLASTIKRRADRVAFRHTFKVGDIFRQTWGYDQTNVNYFEVTRTSDKCVWVREIEQASFEDGNMTGRTTPQPGKFLKDSEERKCLARDGAIKVGKYSFHWASYVAPKMVAGVPTYGTDRFSTYA
jgi:hypothetical protein